jgi:hypothetical protein
MREVTVVGEQQQARGIHVEAAHHDPPPVAGGGNRSKTVGRFSGSARVVTSPTGL